MQVFYFSRTGRSEKIANEIAKANNVKVNKIDDNIDWGGAVKYVKAGYMANKKTEVPISHAKPVDNEDIVLVFPVWAALMPPAALTFSNKFGRNRIIAVPTSFINNLKDRDGFKAIYDLVGKEIETPKELL